MTGPMRPAFHEGQVLAAADLTATVEYARGLSARHARHLHEWGVAEGLGLVTEPRTDPVSNDRYVEVRVSPGYAVDGTGREVVLTEPVVLRESDFEEVNGADPARDKEKEPYPVFLAAADREPAAPARPDSCGGTGASTRVEESYEISFGRLGEERTVAERQPPAIGDPPVGPSNPWRILLGYVRWVGGHFSGVETEARGVPVRYSGVRADIVSAQSGSLTLRTGQSAQEGKPAVVLSGGDQPGLVFGLYQGGGTVDPLLTMEANGNLKIKGSFEGTMPAGSTLVTSGTATDGMLLPLPTGITAQQVADGRVVVHVHLTPRTPPALGESLLYIPVEATVDDDLRVRCRARLYDLTDRTGGVVERPGAADFLVVATVTATNGGG
ncbi:hypothetical protein ACFS5L_24625 [Streptomyces phyllanthi]|uniref:Uncharacterized protein n=1 Tax=Streptomyces phyllanthi TaxID=1803180 RepID=A0A5N8WAZ1_9ACTN|nr:hypothetical protein [Streptomyces phyllanthi]MPY43966.1 hypothetical protein [Streptomyces phyllanthi]